MVLPFRNQLDLDITVYNRANKYIYRYKDIDGGEDPDLYPLAKIERGDETFYQYQYGLVAIVQKDGSSFCTRMD